MSLPRADHPSVEPDHQADLHDVVHSLQHRLGPLNAGSVLLAGGSKGLPEVDVSAGRDRREFDLRLFGAPSTAGMAQSCRRGIHAELYMARRLRVGGPIVRSFVNDVVSVLLVVPAQDLLQTLAHRSSGTPRV